MAPSGSDFWEPPTWHHRQEQTVRQSTEGTLLILERSRETSPLTRVPPPRAVRTFPRGFQLLTGGQGLLQLLCLLFVCDDQGVKVSAASNFKLHIILIFLDLDGYQRDQSSNKTVSQERDVAQFTCCLLLLHKAAPVTTVLTSLTVPLIKQKIRSPNPPLTSLSEIYISLVSIL